MATSTALLAPAFAGDYSTAPGNGPNVADASLNERCGRRRPPAIGYVWGRRQFQPTFARPANQFTMSGVPIVDVERPASLRTGEGLTI